MTAQSFRITLVAFVLCFACIENQAFSQIAASRDQGQACCASGTCDGLCVDVERGERRPVLDGLGWVMGIPEKILLWNRGASNHNVSEATVNQVANYMQYRGLSDVKLRVNQYDPFGEWDRLVANKRVGAGWKYTLGTMRQIRYIFVPGRIFGGEEYNPYTNTVSLYSDLPSLGMAEAAYAYDVRQRNYPGTYAAVQSLPLVSMWHETLATDDVIHYVAIRGTKEEQQAVRHQLYARYGMILGGEVGGVTSAGVDVFTVVGAVAGHTTAAFEHSLERGVTRR